MLVVSAIMLNVFYAVTNMSIMLHVIMLNVILLKIMAPFGSHSKWYN
jgi:hypothetical protein